MSPSSSRLLFRASDWSIRRELYMGVTKSFSVEARRSHLGVQMCSVIHVWDSSQKSHTHAYWGHQGRLVRDIGGDK